MVEPEMLWPFKPLIVVLAAALVWVSASVLAWAVCCAIKGDYDDYSRYV